MSSHACLRCGAELVSGMSFCRQCGAPFDSSSDELERPTAIFSQPVGMTQRLDPRPTGSHSAASPQVMRGQAGSASAPVAMNAEPRSSGSWGRAVIVGIIIAVAIACVFGVVKFSTRASRRAATTGSQMDHRALVYPGARTMLDVTSASGSGVLQLQTKDDIDKVADWYLEHLKPTKTERVGSMVVLKNGSVTATILSDSGNTNILIKQTH